MNINYSVIYGTAKRPNLHSILQSQTVKIIEIIKLDDTLRVLNPKERELKATLRLWLLTTKIYNGAVRCYKCIK